MLRPFEVNILSESLDPDKITYGWFSIRSQPPTYILSQCKILFLQFTLMYHWWALAARTLYISTVTQFFFVPIHDFSFYIINRLFLCWKAAVGISAWTKFQNYQENFFWNWFSKKTKALQYQPMSDEGRYQKNPFFGSQNTKRIIFTLIRYLFLFF